MTGGAPPVIKTLRCSVLGLRLISLCGGWVLDSFFSVGVIWYSIYLHSRLYDDASSLVGLENFNFTISYKHNQAYYYTWHTEVRKPLQYFPTIYINLQWTKIDCVYKPQATSDLHTLLLQSKMLQQIQTTFATIEIFRSKKEAKVNAKPSQQS